jgi:hypothetical protein
MTLARYAGHHLVAEDEPAPEPTETELALAAAEREVAVAKAEIGRLRQQLRTQGHALKTAARVLGPYWHR